MIILNAIVTTSRKLCQLAYLVVRDGHLRAVNYNFITDVPLAVLPIPAGAIHFAEVRQEIRDDLQTDAYFVGHDVAADIDGLMAEFANYEGWSAPEKNFCIMGSTLNFCALPYGFGDKPRQPTLPELLTRLDITIETVTIWASTTWGRKVKQTVPGGWQDSRWNVAAIYCVLRALATDHPYLIPPELDKIKDTAWTQGAFFDPHPKAFKQYLNTMKKRRRAQLTAKTAIDSEKPIF